jgi:hypothetical protein
MHPSVCITHTLTEVRSAEHVHAPSGQSSQAHESDVAPHAAPGHCLRICQLPQPNAVGGPQVLMTPFSQTIVPGVHVEHGTHAPA